MLHHFVKTEDQQRWQKGRAMRYKQEQFKNLVCVQSEHPKTKLTTLDPPNYTELSEK